MNVEWPPVASIRVVAIRATLKPSGWTCQTIVQRNVWQESGDLRSPGGHLTETVRAASPKGPGCRPYPIPTMLIPTIRW